MTNTVTIALAQTNPTVGDLAGNVARTIETAREAAAAGADLVLYPEMSVVGYPQEDLVLSSAFRAQAMEAAYTIAAATKDLRCDLLIGNVWHDGKRTYNASLLIANGNVTPVRMKYALPNYGVFDEKRWFEPGKAPEVLHWRGMKLGLLICEEVWDEAMPALLKAQGAELILVQNASPYHIGKARERKEVVTRAASITGAPVVYLNLWGGQDELVFDGRSYAVDAAGRDVCRLPEFADALAITTWEKRPHPNPLPQGEGTGWRCVSAPMVDSNPNEQTMYAALVTGLRDYVHKNGFPGVVLGLSGGIDSALSAAIAVDALGADNVMGVRLPSPYTSRASMEDAEETARLLGIRMETIGITALMDTAEVTLATAFAGKKSDTTEENIQARIRGLLLMALSNKFGSMLLTTGNKSEMSVGYATLYGDMCGGFAVLKDVYKTTVYKLARWRNTEGKVIPERAITKAPSAELRPNQTDQDSLPPYEVLDAILRGLIERQLSVKELVAEGLNEHLVARVASMLLGAEYKRRQSAPGVKITPMAFGRDRRWPITNRWQFG